MIFNEKALIKSAQIQAKKEREKIKRNAWIEFAQAGIVAKYDIRNAALFADDMLEEFLKRFK